MKNHYKVTAQNIDHTEEVELQVPADRFWVRDQVGSAENDYQIRLEPDGSVYLCYTLDKRRTIEAITISFEKFDSSFREFVDCLVKDGDQDALE